MSVTIRRLGVIGDLHGEDRRLARALDWFASQALDALVCTGDLADGTGCLDTCCRLLQQAGVITVAGNHDRWLLQGRVRHLPDAHRRDQLAEDSRAFLESLPGTRELETAAGRLLLCHGVDGNDLAKVWPGTPRSAVKRSRDLDRLIHERRCRFLVNGHLHYRVLIDFPELLLINAGTLKGEHAGVSVMDFAADQVAAYSLAGPNPRLVAEHPLTPGRDRRVWRDTADFDGSWEPCTLHA